MADAIRGIHQGYGQLGPTIAPKVFAQASSDPLDRYSSPSANATFLPFNPRERDVLMQLALGSSNREIALALHVTEGTVKNYITRILSELGVRDRMQAALWAQKHANALRSIDSIAEE